MQRMLFGHLGLVLIVAACGLILLDDPATCDLRRNHAMTCNRCGKSLAECQCPDIDERLHAIAYSDAPITFKWCRLCDRHYARCRCVEPDFIVMSGGKPVPIPDGGFKNLAGGRVVPDLRNR